MKIHYLPDSSIVTLNERSELTYEIDQWSSSRQVSLKGEGFFQVKHGSAFKVVTSDGIINVLGTSFNVKQRNKFYEVICYEGKVGVKTVKQNVTLCAGDGFRNTTSGDLKFQIASEDQPGWLNGRSSFSRTPYFVILEELENQYGIIIETQNIDLNGTFTGSFPNNNLNVALEAVTIPSGYAYELRGDNVLIKGEKN